MLYPELLVTAAQAQSSKSRCPIDGFAGLDFSYSFAIMVLGGITLIIYNGIAIRKGTFVKADVVQPIMQELQNLNIDGAINGLTIQVARYCSDERIGSDSRRRTRYKSMKRASGNLRSRLAAIYLDQSAQHDRFDCSYDRSARNGCRYDRSLYRFARFRNGRKSSQKMAETSE